MSLMLPLDSSILVVTPLWIVIVTFVVIVFVLPLWRNL